MSHNSDIADVLNDSLDMAQLQLDETRHGEECCSQLHFAHPVSGEPIGDEQHVSGEGKKKTGRSSAHLWLHRWSISQRKSILGKQASDEAATSDGLQVAFDLEEAFAEESYRRSQTRPKCVNPNRSGPFVRRIRCCMSLEQKLVCGRHQGCHHGETSCQEGAFC